MPGHLDTAGRQLCGCHLTCGHPLNIADVFHIIEAEPFFFFLQDAPVCQEPWMQTLEMCLEMPAFIPSVKTLRINNFMFFKMYSCSKQNLLGLPETAQSNESKCDKICLA